MKLCRTREAASVLMTLRTVRLVCLFAGVPLRVSSCTNKCNSWECHSHADFKELPSSCVLVCVCAYCIPGALHHLPHSAQSCLTEVCRRDPVVAAAVTLCDCQAHLWGQVMIRCRDANTLTHTFNCVCLLVSGKHLLQKADTEQLNACEWLQLYSTQMQMNST